MLCSRPLASAATAVLLVSLSPQVAHATVLVTSGGQSFDIQDGLAGTFGTDGSIGDGTSDSYDGCYRLEVNGITYMAAGALVSLGGRQVEMPEVAVGALRARRAIYVPATGGDYARYLDIVSNPGPTAMTATIAIVGNLGSDSSTSSVATATGDPIVSHADAWFTTDDFDGSGDPSLAHVTQGTDPPTRAAEVSLMFDNIRYAWTVSIPAGRRVAILTYAVQSRSQAAAQAEARRLVEVPDDALVGLDDYLDDIINFSITVAGAPRVRFEGPFEVEEGAGATVSITVTDPEGTTPTWSWDLDGDGTFGEMPGATSYTLPPGMTDGPGAVRVGVRATDGTNMVDRYRTITVTNVPPRISSSPRSTVASVGARWTYQLEVEDPAGSFDPPNYAVMRGPTDMSVTEAGLVVWVPDELDVTVGTETVALVFTVDDGDGGTDDQAFEITVSPNHPPSDVVLLYPTEGIALLNPRPRFAVATGDDPDLDPLEYFIEVDRDEAFDDPIASGPVAATPGFTAWTPTSPLAPGRYYWRAWVSDGTVETEPRSSFFFVVPDPSMRPDGGPPVAAGRDAAVAPPVDRPRGSCACRATGGERAPSAALLVGLGLAAAIARRRGRRA